MRKAASGGNIIHNLLRRRCATPWHSTTLFFFCILVSPVHISMQSGTRKRSAPPPAAVSPATKLPAQRLVSFFEPVLHVDDVQAWRAKIDALHSTVATVRQQLHDICGLARDVIPGLAFGDSASSAPTSLTALFAALADAEKETQVEKATAAAPRKKHSRLRGKRRDVAHAVRKRGAAIAVPR